MERWDGGSWKFVAAFDGTEHNFVLSDRLANNVTSFAFDRGTIFCYLLTSYFES